MSLDWGYPIGLLCVSVCVSVSVCEWVSPLPAVLYGEVKSPRYPQPYQTGVYEWNLTVPTGYRIQLTFTHLDIQPSENCSRDSLTITFGRESLRNLCGHLPGNHSISSPGNHLHVVFRTSEMSTGSHLGFNAFYVGSNCSDPAPLTNGEAKVTFDRNNQVVEYRCHKPFNLLHGTPVVHYTCSEDGKWRDHKHMDTRPECVPECGRPTVSLQRQRVFGGKKAPPRSVPWQVFLGGIGRGGAFVIQDQWLLTAAHNLVQSQIFCDAEDIKVYVGGNSLTEMQKKPHLKVQAVRVHPLYNNPDRQNFDHDIALIQLKQKVTFSPSVLPLCLPSTDDEYIPERIGMVSGFGLTEKQMLATDLRFVKLPLVDQKTCNDFVNNARSARPDDAIYRYTENMFCAGFPEGGKDSCTGDSGGAFAFKKDGRYWAAGIVSWGVGCGEPGYYGVYTRVSKYTDWINRIMDNQFTDCGDPKPLLNGGVKFLSITEKQYLSVIEYHCNEPYYASQGTHRVQYTCAADGVWRDRNNSDIIPACIPVCGRPVKNGTVSWQISVSVDGVKGAGAVIGDRWVLTAASNLLPKGAAITAQQVNLYIRKSALQATSLHVHPSYNKSDSLTAFNHDIALVKLKSPITFNADVMPLCLPTERSYSAGQRGLVSAFKSSSSGHHGVWLQLVDHVRCCTSDSSSRHAVPTNHTLCSKLPEGVKSLPSGDMGAALGVEEGGRFGVAGVLLRAVANQEGTYGVYTRVSPHHHWISSTMQQHFCDPPELPDLVEVVNSSIRYEHNSEIQLKCASKYYRLEGQETYTCAADGLWRSGTGHSRWPKCVPECGITDTLSHSSGRILGGRVARLRALPWHLLVREPHRASASLLSDRWALTAASVVDGYDDQNFTLYGGIVEGQDNKRVIMVSEKVVVHPGFQKGLSNDEHTSYDNDIALIKLSSRVRLSPALLPVCLPERAEGPALEGKMGTVSGFGAWEKGRMSRKLRYAAIGEYSQEKCQKTPDHSQLKQPMAFTRNMFCAGLDGSDTCQGDSGGALVQPMLGKGSHREPYRVKGIVSWGPACGSKTYYTKVQNYLDWIRETMEKEK
ncbi:transmembrane protease serine 9-like [Clupea harengus]|uniref:Transmembrane protease serine 9-like n=1 Tax=Clupea harengus TaxID=7950 RepID=A0A6P8GCV1_CLUHA|nr:transmembrane protease serine 9-like [Clupea harengus]